MQQLYDAMNGLLIAVVGGLAIVATAFFYALKTYIPRRMELQLERQKQELEEKARQRKIQYEQKIQELEQRAQIAESIHAQGESIGNLATAVIEMAKSEAKRTDILHSNTQAVTSTAEGLGHLSSAIDALAVKVDQTHDHSSATRKSADEARAAVVGAAADIVQKVDDLIRVLTIADLMPVDRDMDDMERAS